MTNYNVVEDRADWARVKVSLMNPGDRKHLMRELIKQDEAGAYSYMGQLVAEQHGLRKAARQRVNYP